MQPRLLPRPPGPRPLHPPVLPNPRALLVVDRLGNMDESWAEQRRRNAKIKAEALERQQAAESAQASEYLLQFVRAANALEVAPAPLEMRDGQGKRKSKTKINGWYLKADKSMAVDVDGKFYLLTAPLTLKEVFLGSQPTASPPPLILGKGGRDGEQIDLVDALSKVVPTWREY